MVNVKAIVVVGSSGSSGISGVVVGVVVVVKSTLCWLW